MFVLTPECRRFAQRSMFPDGVPPTPVSLVEWRAPDAAAYLDRYKRRAYRSPAVPRVDRSRYAIEYHSGEGACCSRHAVMHDTDRSFVLAYDDIPIGVAGFELQIDAAAAAPRRSLVVSQMQGTRYRTRHSDRDTGAEAPARSVSWPPALLNLVVAFAPLVGAVEVVLVPHYRRRFNFGRFNVERLYEGTASNCGFEFDPARDLWMTAITD